MKTIILALLCSFLVTHLGAQTQLKEARSWKTVYSLLDKTLTQAKSILKNEGFEGQEKIEEKDAGIDVSFFYPIATKDIDEEPMYWLGSQKEKVIFLNVNFEYAETSTMEKDLTELRKNLVGNGFILDRETKEEEYVFYHYRSDKTKNTAIIGVARDWASFTLMLGDPKIVKWVAGNE